MQLEAIRIVADWLADETTGYGVNEFLLSVELDGGDTRPEPVTVHDSTRHGWVARRRLSREGSGIHFPTLAVMPAPEVRGDGNVMTIVRNGEIDIGILHVDQDHESASGTAASLYRMRAVMRSLNQLNQNAQEARRTRNSIYLQNWRSFSESAAEIKWGDNVVVAPLLVTTWTIRDNAPAGPSAE